MTYRRHTYRADIAGPAWLYRLHSGADLIYVGVSSNPKSRFVIHRRKPWWRNVDRVQFQWFPSRAAAFAAERVAIIADRPRYNIARPKVAVA